MSPRAIWMAATIAVSLLGANPLHAEERASFLGTDEELAIVVDPAIALRASARAAAPVQAQLARGDLLEVRGAVPGYLRVYDHRRERPGFVRPSQVRRYPRGPAAIPQLTAVALFLRDQPGSEELGIAYATLARTLGADALSAGASDAGVTRPALGAADPLDDAIAAMTDRLARRASQARAVPDPSLAIALDSVAAHGVKLVALERDGHVVYCSEGEAEARALAHGDASERARAALLLTQARCGDPSAPPNRQLEWNEWRARIACSTEASEAAPELGVKLRLRRAEIWSQLAFLRASDEQIEAALSAQRELALADRTLLAEDDQAQFDEASVRVSAARWPAANELSTAHDSGALGLAEARTPGFRLRRAPSLGRGGVELFTQSAANADAGRALVSTPSSAVPQLSSFDSSPGGHAAALVVQPLASWSELWVFHPVKLGRGKSATTSWVRSVLVPAAIEPGVGSVECAGFTPKGKSMLVVRQAMVNGKLQRSFQELSLDTLRVVAQSDHVEGVRAFGRWASPQWRAQTTALR